MLIAASKFYLLETTFRQRAQPDLATDDPMTDGVPFG
jgi:hypothetical protein